MESRLSYSHEHMQIDGSLRFDTDDYIVEARRRQEVTGREHLDVFMAKVERERRNALASSSACTHSAGMHLLNTDRPVRSRCSPAMTSSGSDGHMGLDAFLGAEKRHVSETGDCNLPARQWVVSRTDAGSAHL